MAKFESRKPRENDAKPESYGDREAPTAKAKAPKDLRVGRRKDEVKISGVHACHAVFTVRREDIVRVYVVERMLKEFSELLSWCAKERKAYHVVTPEDMEKIAETVHNEGVCILARQGQKIKTLTDLLGSLKDLSEPVALVMMEGVQNPHNVGALLRVAAFFGAKGMIVGPKAEVMLPSAVYRTAEGGAEYVPMIAVDRLEGTLKQLKAAGFKIVATSERGKASLFKAAFPKRCVFMFGAEREGLSDQALQAADQVIAIPGSGQVGSLNVSCAGAVVLGEFVSRHLASK